LFTRINTLKIDGSAISGVKSPNNIKQSVGAITYNYGLGAVYSDVYMHVPEEDKISNPTDCERLCTSYEQCGLYEYYDVPEPRCQLSEIRTKLKRSLAAPKDQPMRTGVKTQK
ncbi:MAG: hypothetical protein ACLQDM_13200, partial [Bradyrhizobium sp.]